MPRVGEMSGAVSRRGLWRSAVVEMILRIPPNNATHYQERRAPYEKAEGGGHHGRALAPKERPK
jgi:hypothetical protein